MHLHLAFNCTFTCTCTRNFTCTCRVARRRLEAKLRRRWRSAHPVVERRVRRRDYRWEGEERVEGCRYPGAPWSSLGCGEVYDLSADQQRLYCGTVDCKLQVLIGCSLPSVF